VNNTPTASFYQYDGRGTVRMLTNSAGAVTDTYEYDAFGNLIASTGSTPNAYLYRGERYDSDLGLYYLRARWYNPVTGRFMTRDPYQGSIYDPASLHRYNYARANPVNFIDPSGRDAASEYPLFSLNTVARASLVTSAGFAINCAYYSLASATNLVGETIGQQVNQVGLLFQGCAASITASQYLTALAANTALLGLGEVGEWALGKWLGEAEEGEPALGCALCFPAGTPVHTDHGTVPIESIKVGDNVWARSREAGENELRPVTAVAPQHRDKLMELRIAGEEHALRVSPVHPFWSRRNADEAAHWIEAGNLVAGEQVETKDGRWVEVQLGQPA
jgi:RHS repeat-associated protein